MDGEVLSLAARFVENGGELFDDDQSLVSVAENRTRLKLHQKGISNLRLDLAAENRHT